MKRVAKKAVLEVASHVAPHLWRLRPASSLLVLMYHRVLPQGHPARRAEQPGMYVSPESLAMHMQAMRRRFTLVHLDDWLDAVARNDEVPARACAITFDDGWRDNYQFAFPVLQKAQAPATIYLVTDLVGTSYSFWPNSLARVLSDEGAAAAPLPEWLRDIIKAASGRGVFGRLNPLQIDAVISTCKNTRTDAEMIEALAACGAGSSSQGRDLMSWDEIREMQASGLIRFGSHTRRHTRLPGVTSAESLQDEILGSRQIIEQQLGVRPRTFCYPNGDVSAAAEVLVRSAYHGAVTTRSGWHVAGEDRFLMRRVGLHESISSRSALYARISGWI